MGKTASTPGNNVTAPNLKNTSGEPHIPDSFDLLELNVEENGSYSFKNNIRKRQAGTGHTASNSTETEKRGTTTGMIASLIQHGISCVDCKSIGNEEMFIDVEEDPEYSQLVAIDFRREFGPEANKTPISSEWEIHKLNVPYIGYGNCKHSEMIITLQKPKSEELDDVIQFYLASLRADCRHALVSEIRGWLTTKLRFLHIQPDLSLKVLPSSPLL